MPMLKENIKQLKKSWEAQKISLAKPLSEEEIIAAFAEINIFVPKDVIEVYTNFGGFDKDDMDSELITFWSIEKIIRESRSSKHNFSDKYTYFADHLIDSYWYGFEFRDAEYSSVFVSYDKNDNRKVADSFGKFFEIYLKTPNKIFFN